MNSGVEFELDGEKHRLRFGMNALARYEDIAGETAHEAFSVLEAGKVDAKRLIRLFRCGSGAETDEAAGDMIDAIGLVRTIELMGEAMKSAFGSVEGNVPSGRKKPAR